MEKILGIDTGTNSLGWAIIEKNDKGEISLLHKGTNIFTEGVKIEKGIESSKASERTEHRALRKHYWRRKVRKIRVLKVLVDNRLCPPLDSQELRDWRLKKVYPHDEEFLAWQRTEDKNNVNPYQFRYICLTQKLDLDSLTQRYILGRALYHLNQRRGFLSNRKETTKASDGAVSEGISNLTTEMQDAGCEYLGEYFYRLYQSGEKIRGHYIARNEHYLKEFQAICEKQQLPEELVEKLKKALFFQRPLKSQKGTVGTCTFEKGKTRCPASHPMYEEFRLYSFLNNIKIKTPADTEMRYLNGDEKAAILPLFKKYRKSKHTFNFEDIAKKLAGKGKYMYFRDRDVKPYQFNYQMDTPVPISTVTAQLEGIFGVNWLNGACEVYTLADGKTPFQIMNDIWHALFFYDDEDKLKSFAMNRLQLNEEDAEKFANISMPNDYASLSLKAIRKILPFLKDYGLIYSQAVFLANLDKVLPNYFIRHEDEHQKAINAAVDAVLSYDSAKADMTFEQYIADYLLDQYEEYGLVKDDLKQLYHPSMIEQYPRVQPNDDGIYQLGSPRISSVRNPMAMRSMFRLRKVVNLLLAKGYIDENTKVHIEFSRDLNDANRRWAIQQWQRQQEKNREESRKRIQEAGISNPTDTDILKYQLWEEQNHICIYTGNQIRISDFLGANPKYDKEHTIPQSAGGDSTKMNLTLCENEYNRKTKKTKLPSELPKYDEILQRVEHWNERAEELSKRIRKLKSNRATTKEEKDKIIRQRHLLSLERDYWRGKYRRFTMTEVPEGFSRRQGTDISVISRYARMFLKSVFKQVYIVKGIATSDFRKMWGIQEEYTAKERVNHVHHCIDAITIACIDNVQYAKLAQFYHDEGLYEQGLAKKPTFEKPWPTFVADIKHIQDELLIAHYSKDNMPKHTRKKDGKILLQNGILKPRFIEGDTARGSLHNDTYYGAIERDGEIRYVVRKSLDTLDAKDVDKIVDEEVKQKVKEAIAVHGSLKAAVEATIWMNEEKQIPIKKVRVFANSVTRPINIRRHRDKSRHEHKQQFHVQNDRNYMMAIYVGQNAQGRETSTIELINSITAANYFSKSINNASLKKHLVPEIKNGLPLKYRLKIGTMVILYEKNPDEVWQLSKQELQQRLYKVTGLNSFQSGSKVYGRISLVHHQDARPSTEIKLKNGAFSSTEEFRPGILMLHGQFKALINGVDFEINDLGEITRKK